MAADAKRYIVPYAVGLAPALLVALTWAPSGDWSPFKLAIRGYAMPIVGAELFAIIVATREGLLKSLPRWKWSWRALIAIATLTVTAVATAATAPLRFSAILLTAYWIVHGLFGISILYLCGRLFKPQDLLRAYLAGFAVFAALFFIYLFQIPDWSTFDWKNQFLSFGHIRHAGYYLAAMAALSIGAMAVAQTRMQWLLAWLSASFGFGAALWTGSRGAAAAIVGALFVSVMLVPVLRNVRNWGGALAAMAASTAVVWLAPAAPSYLMGLRRTVEATAASDVTTGRTTIWNGVIEAIERRPLFGYGEGQMSEVAPYSVMVQPHNSVLQVTLAWGLVGLACVTVILFAFAVRALPIVRTEGEAVVPAFMAMAAVLVLSLYDGSLYYPLPQSIFAACAAIVASRWRSASSALEPLIPARATS